MADVMDRIRKLMQDALGMELAVRYDSRTVQTGVVRKVEFVGWRERGESGRVAQFKVTMECGRGEHRNMRDFVVERLPHHTGSRRAEVKSVDYKVID